MCDIMVLMNESRNSYDKINIGANDEPAQFGTDTCVTHHIYSDLSHYIDYPRELGHVSVREISGSSLTAGIRTVEFTLEDLDGNIDTVRLDNVIDLPEGSKNIISIAQWLEGKEMTVQC